MSYDVINIVPEPNAIARIRLIHDAWEAAIFEFERSRDELGLTIQSQPTMRARPPVLSPSLSIRKEEQNVGKTGHLYRLEPQRSIPFVNFLFANLLWLRNNPQIRLRRLPPFRKLLFGFIVRNCGQDDHIFTIFPVNRCCHLVLGGELD